MWITNEGRKRFSRLQYLYLLGVFMIIDLDKPLYVVDDRTHSHKVSSIDILNKIVYCTDGTQYEYGTNPLTVTIVEN